VISLLQMQRQFLCRPIPMSELALQMYGEDNAASRRRVTRLLRRRERDSGKSIIIGGGHGTKLYTTLALLRSGAPELVDNQSQLVRMLEQCVEDIREDVATTRRYARSVGRRVASVNTAVSTLTKMVSQSPHTKVG